MNVPVVPAEIDVGNAGPAPRCSFSGSFNRSSNGYFSSSVTLAAAAGAASTVTGVGSALRIRFRTAACTEALY
jgi:hypothetical protein